MRFKVNPLSEMVHFIIVTINWTPNDNNFDDFRYFFHTLSSKFFVQFSLVCWNIAECAHTHTRKKPILIAHYNLLLFIFIYFICVFLSQLRINYECKVPQPVDIIALHSLRSLSLSLSPRTHRVRCAQCQLEIDVLFQMNCRLFARSLARPLALTHSFTLVDKKLFTKW